MVSASAKPTNAWSSAALLEHIDRKSGDMQTKETPTRIEYEPATRKTQRPRWLVPALAGGTAVIAALVLASVFLTGGEESNSQYAEAAAGGDPQAIAGLFSDSFRIGDVDTIIEYLHPEFNTRELADDEVGLLSAWVEFEGALYERNEPGPSTCQGPFDDGWYHCTYVSAPGGILASVGYPETSWSAQIVDGLIRRMDIAGELPEETLLMTNYVINDFEKPLGEYALEADPDGSAAACDVLAAVQDGKLQTRGIGTVYNQACGAFLADFVDDYAASLSG
jgi:hypothetical protein